jgi:RNA polymerase subunit RPABC4/transcription elongation factor Spt4
VPDWTRIVGAKNPFDTVSNFFKSSTWHFVTLLFFFFIVVVWLSCAYWVFKDARRRIDDRIIITVSVLAAVIFGPFGLIVYTIVRPPEYLDDVHERELEMRMIEARLSEEQHCAYCKTPVRDDFLVCPNCQRRLRGSCTSCHRPLEPAWKICPYCETPVGYEPSPARERLFR